MKQLNDWLNANGIYLNTLQSFTDDLKNFNCEQAELINIDNEINTFIKRFKRINDTFYKEKKGTQIEIKEYTLSESGKKRYSAHYEYRGIEYFLIGTMEWQDFEKIVDNLYFIS